MATTRANKSTADETENKQQESKTNSTPRKSTTRSKTSAKATTAKTRSTTGTTRSKSTGTKAKSTRTKSSTTTRAASTKRESSARSKADNNPIRAVQGKVEDVVSDVRHEVARAERTWREEITVAGNQLGDRVKELAADGTALRLAIKHEGKVLIEVPLAAAVVGGALTVWAAPILAAITAIGGAVAHVTLEVERKGTRPKASSKK